VSIVRWNLKEAVAKRRPDEQKSHEADVTDKGAKRPDVRYLHGSHGSKCGGHRREGGGALPGEICRIRHFRKDDNRCREAPLNPQKSADDIVGGIDPTEGRNMRWRMRALSFDAEGETE
jgi:hypothetical protein